MTITKYYFLSLCCGLILAGCNDTPTDQTTSNNTPAQVSPAPQPKADTAAKTQVLLKTSKGDILLELYPNKAPLTVANFLTYVQEGYFTDTIFHRVIPNFMIQGGGFTADMAKKKTHAPVKNEASNGLANERGTIAMARTNNPDSATSQFFINVKNNASLNYRAGGSEGYTVFGKVLLGMDVADAIVSAPTTIKNGMRDVPIQPILILSATAK